jgi:hypothetical protein
MLQDVVAASTKQRIISSHRQAALIGRVKSLIAGFCEKPVGSSVG